MDIIIILPYQPQDNMRIDADEIHRPPSRCRAWNTAAPRDPFHKRRAFVQLVQLEKGDVPTQDWGFK